MNAKIQHFSFLFALALFAVLPAQATTYDWTGTTSIYMDVTTNWSTSVVPTGTDIARWNAASYTNNATASGSQTIGELLFDSGNTNALTLGGGQGPLTLMGVAGVGIQMNSGSGAVDTKSAKFKLGASQTWLNNSSSLLTVSSTITNSANLTPYTLTIDGTGNATLAGIISNNGTTGTTAITKIGTGTLLLSGANTFTGGLIINSGTVTAQTSGSALGNGTVTLGDTTGSSSATLLFSGATTLNYTNAITVREGSSGTLSINANNTGASTGVTFSGAVTLNNAVSLAQLVALKTSTFSGTITGGSGITIGSGNLGTVVLTGDNTYSGDTRIKAGSLAIGSASGNVTLALQNSTLDLDAADAGTIRFGTSNATTTTSATFGGLKGTRNLALTNANATPAAVALTVGGNNGNTTYSGNLTGTGGSLTKSGSGTLTLSGTNTYTGTTAVSTGTLLINGNQSSASGNVTVISGAILGGNGTVGGATTINAGATLSPGNSPGNLTFSNGLTLAGAYKWELAALSTSGPGTNFDVVTVTAGDVNITGSMNLTLGVNAPSSNVFWTSNQTWTGIVNNTGVGSLTGSFAAIDNSSWSIYGAFSTANVGNDVNLVWTAVPEPATWVLAFSGISFVLVARRLRHRC